MSQSNSSKSGGGFPSEIGQDKEMERFCVSVKR